MHGLRLAQYAYHACDFDTAMRYAQSCMTVHGDKITVKSLCELDQPQTAISIAQAAMLKAPEDGHCDYLLGMAHYLAGHDRQTFADSFHQAAAKRHPAGQLGMAFLAFADGNPEQARSYLENADITDPELDHIRCLMLFQILAGRDNRAAEDALYAADNVLARGPSQLRHLWGQLCWVRHLRTSGDLKAARRLLRRVIAQTPTGKAPRLERNIAVASELIASGNQTTDTLNMPANRCPAAIRRKPVLLAMFQFLSSRHGAEKEDLVKEIWQEDYNPLIHDDRIYKTIGRLRKALGDDLKAPRILTQVGRQYILNLDAKAGESQ